MNDLTFSSPSVALQQAGGRAKAYIASAKAANTIRAYRADWNAFHGWCESRGCLALPATPWTIALYLSDHGDRLKTSTIQRRLAAISKAHQAAGHDSPASMKRY